MCHDQNDELAQTVSDLMSQEQEKEITKISTMQGQSIGLIALLLERGLLEPDDVHHWESLSERAGEALKKILTNGDAMREDNFVSEEDMLEARLDFLDGNIEFGHLLRHGHDRMTELQEQRGLCVARLQELQSDAEAD